MSRATILTVAGVLELAAISGCTKNTSDNVAEAKQPDHATTAPAETRSQDPVRSDAAHNDVKNVTMATTGRSEGNKAVTTRPIGPSLAEKVPSTSPSATREVTNVLTAAVTNGPESSTDTAADASVD